MELSDELAFELLLSFTGPSSFKLPESALFTLLVLLLFEVFWLLLPPDSPDRLSANSSSVATSVPLSAGMARTSIWEPGIIPLPISVAGVIEMDKPDTSQVVGLIWETTPVKRVLTTLVV